MLLKDITLAMKEYTRKPLDFVWTILMSIILNLVCFGAFAGAFLLIYYVFSLLGIGGLPILIAIVAGVLLLLYLVVMNGLKGALIKTLLNLTKKERPSMVYFFKYAMDRGKTFFGITLVKTIISLVPLVPIYLLYSYVLASMNILYIEWILGIIAAGILFLIEFPFAYAYIAAVREECGVKESLKQSIRLIRKKFVSSFGLYAVYAVVWVSIFIPLLDLVTALIIYPIMYTAMLLFYEKYK